MTEQWILMMKKNDFKEIGKACGISPFLVRILCNRGIDTLEKVQKFLNGTPKDLYDPYLLKDMEKAQDILLQKIVEHKKIRIIGDYDVDGVTSAYILIQSFRTLGADASAVIPHRIEDGYGLNANLVLEAIEDKIDTIVTCDNGISASEEIKLAKEHGMTVVVTDHHDVPYEETDEGGRKEILPEADAVVNPKQAACSYPFKGICGAVVAYKLAMALLSAGEKMGLISGLKKDEVLAELLEFAAFGTVCDVMELFDENRIFVKYGLKSMEWSRNVGLRSLIEVNGLEGAITNYHVGFVIGPCVNATGRLDTAKRALELFLENDEKRAMQIAAELKNINDLRKAMTQENLEKAMEMIEGSSLSKDRVLVVYLPECHESLAGILAGRIREAYYKPTFVVTDSKDGLKGSGRSIESYHMRDGLYGVQEYLTQYGGHKLAAGFSLKKENLEVFRRKLNENCQLTEEDLQKKVYIDIDLPIAYATMEFVTSLSILEPFGTGNKSPLFAQKNVTLLQPRVMGAQRRAVRMQLKTQDGAIATGIYFGDGDAFMQEMSEKGNVAHVIYSPKLNEYRNERSVQLEIKHYRFVNEH